MKKIIVVLFASVTTAFLLGGCTETSSEPNKALSAFFDAMLKKDMEAVRKFTTEDSKEMINIMELGMKMTNSNADSSKYDLSKIEIGKAVIDGDKATISVKEKSSGEATNFILKKENNSWKVSLNIASMMEMGTNKMKETGISADSIKQMMEEFKQLNLDSLKDEIGKGYHELDSAKKDLN